nr:type II toxin-antitoxin system RelB/DinJ family antitoxin [Succinivibrionaceae bacterium]
MSYTTISISVDAELKMKAGKILNDLGLDLETAITMFLQSVVRCGGMPFDTEEAEQEKEEPNAEASAAPWEYRAIGDEGAS